jgi:hypothetical protein
LTHEVFENFTDIRHGSKRIGREQWESWKNTKTPNGP